MTQDKLNRKMSATGKTAAARFNRTHKPGRPKKTDPRFLGMEMGNSEFEYYNGPDEIPVPSQSL